MKLGLLLACPPQGKETEEVCRIASETLLQGNDVYLYLIDDGVKNLTDANMQKLRGAGVKLFACAYGAKKRGIAWESEKAVFSGLTALVDIIAACDVFRAFTPLGISPESKKSPHGGVPRTLLTIREDPRTSHRPAEAIRIAAGIGSWKKTEVDILIHGPATHLLDLYADEYVDGENFSHYLPIIREWKRPVFLAPDAEIHQELKDSETKFDQLAPAEVEKLQKNASFSILF